MRDKWLYKEGSNKKTTTTTTITIEKKNQK